MRAITRLDGGDVSARNAHARYTVIHEATVGKYDDKENPAEKVDDVKKPERTKDRPPMPLLKERHTTVHFEANKRQKYDESQCIQAENAQT